MITPDDITVVDVRYRFLDEPVETISSHIAIYKTIEECEALDAGLESNDPEWVQFDEYVFFYIHEYLGETLEDLYKNGGHDFVLVREEADV